MLHPLHFTQSHPNKVLIRFCIAALCLLAALPTNATETDTTISPTKTSLLLTNQNTRQTGIPSIDTLKAHEWDIQTNRKSLAATLSLGLIPGGSQYYSEHYIRGAFLTVIELGLAYEVFINKKQQQNKRIQLAKPLRDSLSFYSNAMNRASDLDSFSYYHSIREQYGESIRRINDKKIEEEDLRKAETAWLIGLHLYGYLDGLGIWWHNQGRKHSQKSPIKAATFAILPGMGQIYNQEFGKAGLLYMGLIGAITSINTSQSVVQYYLERRRILKENAPTPEKLEYLNERITFYRKNRNQYIWGSILIYLYSVGDAFVDAMMSDFDSPLYFAASPTLNKGFQATLQIDF